jgi:hypothetical protein
VSGADVVITNKKNPSPCQGSRVVFSALLSAQH